MVIPAPRSIAETPHTDAESIRELETKSLSLKKHLKDSVTAIRFLDATPPIQGITRAKENKLIDPVLGTPIDVWQERLASIFTGFMQTDDSILQARYIMLEDGGQEIVRVDRNQLGEINRLQGLQLQKKGQRDYMIKASMLDNKSVYISPINYNRENGQIQEPYISTFRVAKPVFDEKNKILTVESPQGTQIYLMNNEGEFLYHPNPQLRFGFEFNKAKTWTEEFSTASTMAEQGTLPLSNYPDRKSVV